jgi:hypothetical protein
MTEVHLNDASTEALGRAATQAQDLSQYIAMAWALEMRTNEPAHWRESAEQALRSIADHLGYDLSPKVKVLGETA